MKYVFVSKYGDITPLAQRVEDEGNQVDLYVCKTDETILDKHITASAPDMIVFDSYGFGGLAHRLRTNGFSVIGASPFTDRLESDMLYENKILKMCGLDTSSLGGIPVMIEGWYNGKLFFNHFYCIDGVVSCGVPSDKLFANGLNKLCIALRKAEYCGPVSLCAFASKEGVSYSHLQARFSLISVLALKEGLRNKVSAVLQTMVSGQSRAYMLRAGYFTAVQMFLPSDTLFNGDHFYDITVENIESETLKHLWLHGFTNKKNGTYYYRNKGGRVATATARGDTIREARRRVSRTIGNLKIMGLLHNQREGATAAAGYCSLRTWGYIT